MKDVSFCVPTRFIVGKDTPAQVGEQIAAYGGHRVLIVDDGGSYLTELLQAVRSSIAREGLEAFGMEHKAVSPRLSIVMEGVGFCKENDLDFILDQRALIITEPALLMNGTFIAQILP